MTWFALSLLVAGISAAVNLLDKHLLVRYVRSPVTAVTIVGLFSFIFGAGLLVFRPDETIGVRQAALPVLAGIFEIVSIYLYLRAINHAEVAYLVPVFALAPVFVLAISLLFLKSSLAVLPSAGILVVIVGIALLAISKQGRLNLRPDRSFSLMIVAALAYGLHTMFLDRGLETFSLYDNLLWSRWGVAIGLAAILLWTRSLRFADLRSLKSYSFILSEVLYFLSVWIFLLALARGPASYVIGIVNVQPLFVFGASYLLWKLSPRILQEEFHFERPFLALVSILVIAAGSVMVTL